MESASAKTLRLRRTAGDHPSSQSRINLAKRAGCHVTFPAHENNQAIVHGGRGIRFISVKYSVPDRYLDFFLLILALILASSPRG
jgi:hypothetical protein